MSLSLQLFQDQLRDVGRSEFLKSHEYKHKNVQFKKLNNSSNSKVKKWPLRFYFQQHLLDTLSIYCQEQRKVRHDFLLPQFLKDFNVIPFDFTRMNMERMLRSLLIPTRKRLFVLWLILNGDLFFRFVLQVRQLKNEKFYLAKHCSE